MALSTAYILFAALLAVPVASGLVGVVLPSFGWLPLIGHDAFSLEPWRELLASPGLLRSATLSLATGLIATAGALGTVALFFAACHGTAAFRVGRRLLSPLLSVPHAAAALGLAFLLVPSGWVMRLASPELTGLVTPPDYLVVHDRFGLTMAGGLIAKEIPFLFLMAVAALPQVDFRRDLWIAESFGYGRVAGWLFIVFPQVYRQIRLPVMAVLAYSVSVVDVAIILGPTTPPPLAVLLVDWMNDPDLALRLKASAGAVLQLAIAVLAAALWLALERLTALAGTAALARGLRFAADRALRVAAAGVMFVAMAATAAGLALMALWSVAGPWPFPDAYPRAVSLRVWMTQSENLAEAVRATVAIGLPAVAVALALVLAALESRERLAAGRRPSAPLLACLYAPLLVPQVAFLFGLQVAFLRLGIDATLVALVLVHLVFVAPYMFFSLVEPWQAWDRRYARVAAALGHGPDAVFWRVRAPMLLRSVLTAAAVGFAVSAGLYLPTLLIGGGRFATVTTEAVALSAGGNRRIIGAYALMQMVLPFLGFALSAAVTALFMRGRRGLWVGA